MNGGPRSASPISSTVKSQAAEEDSLESEWYCETPGNNGWCTPSEPWRDAEGTSTPLFMPDDIIDYMPVSPFLPPCDEELDLACLQEEDQAMNAESKIAAVDICERSSSWPPLCPERENTQLAGGSDSAITDRTALSVLEEPARRDMSSHTAVADPSSRPASDQ